MAITPSPLRYPGGKTSISTLISNIIKKNNNTKGIYCEPYVGGGGLALTLLFNGDVNEIYLNDLDRSIYCFWYAIINNTDKFVDKILETKVTIDEWYIQREIQKNKETHSDFDVAFSSFFLNRTNRSGIILKAGVIGGYAQQGNYKLDCRFNKKALIEKIRKIEQYSEKIHVFNLDAVDFMRSTTRYLPENTIYYLDPPYFNKGNGLYTNFYRPKEHEHVAEYLNNFKRPWLLTYDNTREIQRLYKKRDQHEFSLNYSAAHKRVATELLIVSDDITV